MPPQILDARTHARTLASILFMGGGRALKTAAKFAGIKGVPPGLKRVIDEYNLSLSLSFPSYYDNLNLYKQSMMNPIRKVGKNILQKKLYDFFH